MDKVKVLEIYKRNGGKNMLGDFGDFAATFEKVLAAETAHPPTQLCTRWNINRTIEQARAE